MTWKRNLLVKLYTGSVCNAPISFPEPRSPWPAVGKQELWEQPFWNNNGNNRILPIRFHAVYIYGACLKWMLPEPLDSCHRPERSWALGTRMTQHRYQGPSSSQLISSSRSRAREVRRPWERGYLIPKLLGTWSGIDHKRCFLWGGLRLVLFSPAKSVSVPKNFCWTICYHRNVFTVK